MPAAPQAPATVPAAPPPPVAVPAAPPAQPTVDDDTALADERYGALKQHIVGLAFSGGGIRSGTFAIGFLQGLAGLHLLKRIDYLSTVSGGGYAGGWLASWIDREGDIANVELQLNSSRVAEAKASRGRDKKSGQPLVKKDVQVVEEEPEPLRHLRAYSSYLTPSPGLLTIDTWTVVMIWLRNVAINMLMLFPAALLMVLAIRWLAYLYGTVTPTLVGEGDDHLFYRWITGVATAVGLAILAVGFALNASVIQQFRRDSETVTRGAGRIRWTVRLCPVAAFLLTLNVPSILAAFGGAVQDYAMDTSTTRSSLAQSFYLWLGEHLGLLGLPNVVLNVALFGLIMSTQAAIVDIVSGKARKRTGGFLLVAVGVASLLIGGVPGLILAATGLVIVGLLGLILLVTTCAALVEIDRSQNPTVFKVRVKSAREPIVKILEIDRSQGKTVLTVHVKSACAAFVKILWSQAEKWFAGFLMVAVGVASLLIGAKSGFAPTVAGLLVVGLGVGLIVAGRPKKKANFWVGILVIAIAALILVVLPLVPGPPWLVALAVAAVAVGLIRSDDFEEGSSGGRWVGWTLVLVGLIMTVATEWPVLSWSVVALGGAIAVVSTGLSRWRYPGAAFVAGGSGGVLFAVLEAILAHWAATGRSDLLATFAVPGAVFVLIASMIVEVALAGRAIRESEREWWASLSARLGLRGLAWIIAAGVILYVPAALLYAEVPIRFLIGSSWAAATLSGALAGLSKTGQGGGGLLPKIAKLAPPLFLAGGLGAVSLLLSYLVGDSRLHFVTDPSAESRLFSYFESIRLTDPSMLALYTLLAGSLFYLAFFGWIDVNLFSLHALYTDRLVRCYLGATRNKPEWVDRWGPERIRRVVSGAPTGVADLVPGTGQPRDPARAQNPVTGFDPKDDLDLRDLWPYGEKPKHYQGPIPLFNATLNLVAGQDLAWRDRKGESFVLTPRYCGSKSTGYAQIPETGNLDDDLKRDPCLTLGRAMAISGAAIDPNMGYLQSPALTAFLTIFNARLGYWIENPYDPNRGDRWAARSPQVGGRLLLSELLGRTTDSNAYIHLSDGGHFDNLGVYELIRRRCRYVVALDAGEDANPSNDNLAALIRLVRIDFGARIHLDTDPFRLRGDDRLTSAHVVVGSIHYEDLDHRQQPGVFVYVKISLTGDEPPDLQRYAKDHTDFPHQPTDFRQSFDEEQFECYRALGDHIAWSVFGGPASTAKGPAPKSLDEVAEANRRFFVEVRRRWSVPPAGQQEHFLETTRGYTEVHRALRSDPLLRGLSHELYPELVPPPGQPRTPAETRAEVHAVGQMLQVIEDTMIALGLNARTELPMNLGWLNVFRRWSSSSTFRHHWAVLRAEFSPDLVRFCDEVLHLQPPSGRLLEWGPTLAASQADAERARDHLAAEFALEWPGEVAGGRDLKSRLASAVAFQNLFGMAQPLAWLIVQDRPAQPANGAAAGWIPIGIIQAARGRRGGIDLFTWVLPAYRSIGMGSTCFPTALKAIERAIQNLPLYYFWMEPTLRVSYPASGLDMDRDANLARWKRFFATYDFEPKKLNPGAPWVDLEKTVGP